MTAPEAAALIDRLGLWTTVRPVGAIRTVRVTVKVLDAREAYGRTDLLITPQDGDGQAWVSAEAVDFDHWSVAA